eukprot:CAMPEP_0118942130 /NCGR_PEP_ID=MMETSP1169-20130426/35487_1 /TAXON_ID=36882 /ORGANISM="Pyramimonas obovata, Strain CCMP722" /LENGTH=50 /DNA_ID=CAMNT_0006887087 /DNA_START=29 /DNA_END=177 /DNA_ORIENTATION=+
MSCIACVGVTKLFSAAARSAAIFPSSAFTCAGEVRNRCTWLVGGGGASSS